VRVVSRDGTETTNFVDLYKAGHFALEASDPTDRTVGIWRVPVAGGPLRLAVRFDDPTRPWHRSGFGMHGDRFYFTVGDRQSDLWMTEMAGSR
jgi:hypothetical protein